MTSCSFRLFTLINRYFDQPTDHDREIENMCASTLILCQAIFIHVVFPFCNAPK
jgi:hypothetical protein